ncbi:MAG TPA: alpha/beta fold hydrolase [Bacteroidia bacterium]
MEKKNEKFILVHSAWLGAWQWRNVQAILEYTGHSVICPDLSGHGNDQTPIEEVTMEHYLKVLTDLIDELEEPIILVGHNFNGITVTKAADLRPDKVKAIVYLTAVLVPNGVSFLTAFQGFKGSIAVDNFYIPEEKTSVMIQSDQIHAAFAHDVPEKLLKKYQPLLNPEPLKPLMYELNVDEAIMKRIPKFYIECVDDRAIPIDEQIQMYLGKVQKIYTLHTSHLPVFSKPEKVAGILLDVVNQLEINELKKNLN